MPESAADNLMAGVVSETIQTQMLPTHVLAAGDDDGAPVVFIHGNASSGRFFEETLATLPEGYRGLAPDLRGFGGSDTKPVDATRGVGDFADDLASLCDALNLSGGDRPQEVASITLINPMSPYGFGGTKDVAGTPCQEDFAGSGGGTANPEFVSRLAANAPPRLTPTHRAT